MTKTKTNQNRNLHKAKAAKKDEFYTQLADIENEVRNYFEHFRGKTVYCNCDDPTISNFYHYFSYNFEFLGLKKLIATCYRNTDPDMFSKGISDKAVKLEYNGFKDGENVPDRKDIKETILEGDGDFRSDECIEILKEADIVVTNPPFSLFRDYVAQLVEYNKQFIVMGPKNAITYKEIFPLMKDNKMWIGMTPMSNNIKFNAPEGNGYSEKSVPVCWFTNMEHGRRNDQIKLWQKYTPEAYPQYDNYDAINVDKVVDIPEDYEGYMGVPITFMDKYNPEQFEIVGMDRPLMTELTGKQSRFKIKGVEKYARIVIKNKTLGVKQ